LVFHFKKNTMKQENKVVRKTKKYSLHMVKGGGVPEMYFIKDIETEKVSKFMRPTFHKELLILLKYKQSIVNWGNEYTKSNEFDIACEYILETGSLEYREVRDLL